MLIRLIPGVVAERAISVLAEQRDALTRLNGNAHEMLRLYLEWVATAAKMISSVLATVDAEHLVYSATYDRLLAIFAATDLTEQPNLLASRVINGLVQDETNCRRAALDSAITSLRRSESRWHGREQLIVPDTNFFLHHSTLLGDAGFTDTFGNPQESLRLIVPIIVVEELDRQKFGRDEVRGRAQVTLARFDSLFTQPTEPATLVPQQLAQVSESYSVPSGGVVVELLFDPPGHRRLDRADDEIIDRASAIQALAGRPVKLVTYDTNMSMKGRVAGLQVQKLDRPPQQPSLRQMRRERLATKVSATDSSDERPPPSTHTT